MLKKALYKLLRISSVLGCLFIMSTPGYSYKENQKHKTYKSSYDKKIEEYRKFMHRQYNICVLQVSIYKKEADLNITVDDLGKLYKRVAILRSEECLMMKQRIKEFDSRIKDKKDRESIVPKMTFEGIYQFGKIKNVAA